MHLTTVVVTGDSVIELKVLDNQYVLNDKVVKYFQGKAKLSIPR